MTILEGQILQKMAYVMLFHAEITSEHYKTRDLADGYGKPFDDAQKLDDTIRTMRRHIHHMGEMVDVLGEDN